MPQNPTRIGVDTGGTFTDFILLTPEGLQVHKTRSTPQDPSQAILEGLTHFQAHKAEITHGSTVATNAVLERKGARIALITTAGFEDVLKIGRQTRARLYDFQVQAPLPLASLTLGIQERTLYDSTILTPLDEQAIPPLIEHLSQQNITSVAVCLLHSYANPRHEQILTQALRAAGLQVSASHEILPEYREFERWSTTAVNAYVTPLMATYLLRLEQSLEQNPLPSSLIPLPSPLVPRPSHLRIMQSNGGSISAARASAQAVQTILSGPAAGVVGAQAIAAASGFTRLITFDMGGTSTDVSLIDGKIGTTMDSLVGDLPVRLPVLDIHTVGAGGGSIAWIDTGGSLRVGPRSAGADPGPACYGKGEHLTVTDANLLLGRLDPAYFLGGRMTLDLARTRRIARSLAKQLNLTERTLAEGILRIANANMEAAIRVVSVQRGYDPRDFALLAFGGAGGLHACALADSLDLKTVLIPEHSGVLSALGMLLADVIKDFSTPIHQPALASAVFLKIAAEENAVILSGAKNPRISPLPLPVPPQATYASLTNTLASLIHQATQALATEGFTEQSITLTPTIDLRYQGQAYELNLPLTEHFLPTFHAEHQRLYGYNNTTRPVEIIQLRLRATGLTDKPTFPIHQAPNISPPPTESRPTTFGRRTHLTPIYHREHLIPGTHAEGPALILTGQSTNVIPPNWTWRIDQVGTLIATRTA